MYEVTCLLFLSSEENGMDQENTNSEEEVAVLTLYKFLCQCTGRYKCDLLIKLYDVFFPLDSTLTTDWILYNNAVKDETSNLGTLASCFLSITFRFTFQVTILINSSVLMKILLWNNFFSQFAHVESAIGSVWVQKTC